MKILVLHNRQLARGGADAVIDAEVAALTRRGHVVDQFVVENEAAVRSGLLVAGTQAVWNRTACRELERRIAADRPDVVHVHTPFPVMSPAVFRTAHRAGVATVTTLHGYRYSCPAGTLQRNGLACHECVGRRVKTPAVWHRCYKDSAAASMAVASGLSVHHLLGTFRDEVDRFIALTPFARECLIEDGIAPRQITVKPNFVDDPGPPRTERGDHVLFVGRLASEKGIITLVEGWKRYRGNLQLVVAGDGAERDTVEALAREDSRVRALGWVSATEVAELMATARALVLPSQWYEAMPLGLLQALAAGTPVVVSDLPNVGELVEEGVTGFHFRPGDPLSLARVISRFEGGDTSRLQLAARTRFLESYREGPVMDALERVYREVAPAAAGPTAAVPVPVAVR